MPKKDKNVRGYAGGGGVYIGDYVNRPGGPQIRGWKPPVPKRKERGYGQAQEGGTGFSGGGRAETEDQRSKRIEKEDANVRGYYHGGGIHSGLPRSMAGIQRASAPLAGSPAAARQVFKKQRGYGQAQEGGTGFSGGGKVKSETEDQRSKKLEKEDANVRGYVHGGNVVGTYMKPYIPPVPKRKQRGYGQAQEGGTGFSGGGKVKKYGGGGKVKKK
jgi:hypothetical protein